MHDEFDTIYLCPECGCSDIAFYANPGIIICARCTATFEPDQAIPLGSAAQEHSAQKATQEQQEQAAALPPRDPDMTVFCPVCGRGCREVVPYVEPGVGYLIEWWCSCTRGRPVRRRFLLHESTECEQLPLLPPEDSDPPPGVLS